MRYWLRLCVLLSIVSSALAETELTVVTEEYPPFNYTDQQGNLKGIAAELATALLKETDFKDTKIQVLPWTKAYGIALRKPNTLIFTVTRSERREKRFHWIGNVSSDTVYLYKHRNRKDIKLPNLAAAKNYRVGGVKLWDTTVWLTQHRIPVLELDRSWVGLKLMDVGKLDLMPHTELSIAYESSLYGLTPSHFTKALKIRETQSEFAMSLDSNPDLVKKFQVAYKKIRNSDIYQKIYDKYVYRDLYDKPPAELTQ